MLKDSSVTASSSLFKKVVWGGCSATSESTSVLGQDPMGFIIQLLDQILSLQQAVNRFIQGADDSELLVMKYLTFRENPIYMWFQVDEERLGKAQVDAWGVAWTIWSPSVIFKLPRPDCVAYNTSPWIPAGELAEYGKSLMVLWDLWRHMCRFATPWFGHSLVWTMRESGIKRLTTQMCTSFALPSIQMSN